MPLYYHPESECYLESDEHPGDLCEEVSVAHLEKLQARIAEFEERRKWHKPEDLLPIEETWVVAIVDPNEDEMVVLRYCLDGWWVTQDGLQLCQENDERILLWCVLPTPKESEKL